MRKKRVVLAMGTIREDVFDDNYFKATDALRVLGLTVPEGDFFRFRRGINMTITANYLIDQGKL